jgi:hypothetical protein
MEMGLDWRFYDAFFVGWYYGYIGLIDQGDYCFLF